MSTIQLILVIKCPVFRFPLYHKLPEKNIDVQAEPVHRDLHALGDWIDTSDSVENDVDGADEDLPGAVEWKEVAQEVEVLALPRLGPVDPFPHVLHVVNLHEQLPVQFLKG